jgi:hypothetical protein
MVSPVPKPIFVRLLAAESHEPQVKLQIAFDTPHCAPMLSRVKMDQTKRKFFMTQSSSAAVSPLQAYIRAHETGDSDFIAQAFSSDARIKGEMGGAMIDWSVADYMARFSGAPAADEYLRTRTFELLDATEHAAMGKVILNYPAVNFVDYMSLLLIDGDWKIVAKTFQATPKS